MSFEQVREWFTTIDLKDHLFLRRGGPETQDVFAFRLSGCSPQVQQAPFGYLLAPLTFSRCVGVMLQPLRNKDMRVFFYLGNVIIMARTKE